MQGLRFITALGIVVLSWIITYMAVESLPQPHTPAHALFALCAFLVFTGILTALIFKTGKDDKI